MSTGDAEPQDSENLQFTDGEVTVMASTAFLHRLIVVNPDKANEKLDFLESEFRNVMEFQGTPISDERLWMCMNESLNNMVLEQIIIELAREQPEWGRDMLRYGWRVIGIGGFVSDNEAKFMERAARVMEVDSETWYWAAAPYVRMGEAALRIKAAMTVLGLDFTATLDEINASMKRVVQREGLGDQEEFFALEDGMPGEAFMQYFEAHDYLVGNMGKRLFGIPPSRDRLLPAIELSICRCFLCGKATKRPPLDQLEEARCKECQALLTFEKELAEAFFQPKP